MNIQFDNDIKLAEFIGILTGDGYVSYSSATPKIGIVCDKIKDGEYVSKYVNQLAFDLFGISFHIFYREDNTIRLYKYSKDISQFLMLLGFPAGKKGNLPMLSCVKENPLFGPILFEVFLILMDVFFGIIEIYTLNHILEYIWIP